MERNLELDLIMLRELAVKPMRKVGPLQRQIEDLALRGLVHRTRAGWALTDGGRLVLERGRQTLH
jgi:hypothetical protein